ncbi:unnamed protein product, partial [Cuscuta europaea]
MKDNHLQTPQKDLPLANRKSKSSSDHSKKALKNAKKNLSSEFEALVEVTAFPESPNDSVDQASVSEVVDDFKYTEAESFVFPLNSEASTSSENSFLSDLTSVSSGIASEVYTTSSPSKYLFTNAEEKTCVETEIAIKHLRQARIEVMNSLDVDLQSKQLMDAIIDIALRQFCGSAVDKICSQSLILKVRLLTSLVLVIVIL